MNKMYHELIQDYIYKNEFEELLTKAVDLGVDLRVITAFSRDMGKKVYVQHRLAEHDGLVWDLIGKRSGSLYVCGYCHLT
jgi:NADPH-ferrihemoprotein reductase